MKHYCFITGLYSRYDTLMFERQGRSLVEAGFRVTYIVCDNEPDEVRDGIQIISTGFKPQNRFDRFFKTEKVLASFVDRVQADIYQISDPELIKFGARLKRKGYNIVFNLREYYPDMILGKKYLPKLLRNYFAASYKHQFKKYFPKYDAIFTVTPEFIDILKSEYGLNNAHLLTNYPIPDLSFSLSEEEYMKRQNTLLYEGTIYSISRQEKVFDAISKIPELHYLLAGVIEEKYDAIKNHPYWSSVEFINGFKKEQLKDFFSRATISNTLRDFGKLDGSLGVIKIFESMEAGIPVIFSDVPTYRAIVEKYNCGLCADPNNSDSIKEALSYLVTHKKEAYIMGQNGRRAVLEEFNWNKQAEYFILIINKILNKS